MLKVLACAYALPPFPHCFLPYHFTHTKKEQDFLFEFRIQRPLPASRLFFVSHHNNLFSQQMFSEYLLCATISFQDLIILGSGQQPGAFQGNEFSLSKHLEVSFQYHSAIHCVLLREFLPHLDFSFLICKMRHWEN